MDRGLMIARALANAARFSPQASSLRFFENRFRWGVTQFPKSTESNALRGGSFTGTLSDHERIYRRRGVRD